MDKQIELVVEEEQVGDVILSLLDVDAIEAEIATYAPSPAGERKVHPFYSLTPDDFAVILVTIPATITSIAGLAKVI